MKRQLNKSIGQIWRETGDPTILKAVNEKLPELLDLIEDLEIEDISFMPSPSGGNDPVQRIEHAISMLKNYRDYKRGVPGAPVKEIIFDEQSNN